MFRLSEFDEKLLDSQRRDSATKELLARHESEIEERHTTIRRLESELGRANGELDRVKNELGQVKEERALVTSDLDRTRRQLTESEGRTRCAVQELNCVRSELSRVTCELSDLDHKFIQQQELTEAKRHSDDLCQTLSTELEHLKVKLADVEGQLVMTRRTNEELENQLSKNQLST